MQYFSLNQGSTNHWLNGETSMIRLKGFISSWMSPPLRQKIPLGRALCCSFEMFFLTIFTKSAKGITARLNTKS